MSTNRDVLEPAAGLPREIGLMVAAIEEVRAQTIGHIADLTESELCTRILPGGHQIGGLVLHLAETEFWWMQVVYGRKEITEEDRRLAHLDDTTETDFALKGYDAERIIDRLNIVHQRTIEVLSGAKDEDLDTVFEFSATSSRAKGSLRWILHHLVDHEATHKGQIAMIKRLLRDQPGSDAAGA